MARTEDRSGITLADVLAALAGALVGLAAGYTIGESVGRVNSRRIRRAMAKWRGGPANSAVWTAEAAELLQARVLDSLARDVVLARRPIRVQVLGMGLVELTGRVLHAPEVGLAGDVVQSVPGVATVLNHLLVEGVDPTDVRVPGPSTPRAARG
jgi:hypothetical protein